MRPNAPDDPDKPVVLMRCSTEFEAELRANTVRSAGIRARVIQAVSATINLGAAMGAPYEVYVSSHDLEAAREAISEAAAGRPIVSAEFDEPEPSAETPANGQPGGEVILSGGAAFAIGLAFGLFTIFIPFMTAMALKAPLPPAERNIFGALWVLFFGMVAFVLRDRFPIASRFEGEEKDDGVLRAHFRDSPVALIGWFLLGAGLLGPASFFFIGLLLVPLMQALAQHTSMAQPLIFYAWCLLCGWWTTSHARQRQKARRAARDRPRLAR